MRQLCLPMLLLTTPAVAADPPARPVWGKPVAELPAQVAAAAGQLTLFADFGHPAADGIPVYVVNRTEKPVSLLGQDRDLYLKLEYEPAAGVWTRAQSHDYSWCGNSYWSRNLEPGRFIVVSGYRPPKGEKARVRYRFYGQETAAASNAGEGLILKAEVERAAIDAMAVRTGDFDLVRKVALGEVPNMAHHRESAIWRLYDGKFDSRESRNVLETISKKKDDKLAGFAAGLLRTFKERREQKK